MESPIEITRFVPTEAQFAWTFGGYPPVMRIRPGDVLDLFTEDAFGGRIRSSDDLPSRTITYPFINPQTGPFFVEGAEPGDTLAIHLIDVQPARDWAVSTTVPLFGALTGTKFTPTLQPALPERTWRYARRPRGRRGRVPGARFRRSRCGCRWSRSSARSGSRRRRARPGTFSSRRPSAATWTRPRRAPARRSTSG